ncbi:MAG: right-handed parallel beta-helix repeat-containing protein [Nitrospinae bacterium]|nr:right-handed parallel beta-helix repeat-containing protein [Nitrospinota bacterium]
MKFKIMVVAALAAASIFAAAPARAATFTVTKGADTNDGVCAADCSLREAITAANTNPGADTITIPASGSTYLIGIADAGADEDLNATGDFDITESVTINGGGGGAGGTLIEPDFITARIFHIDPAGAGGVTVTIDGVWMSGGNCPTDCNGGAIYNRGALTVSNSTISGSSAPSAGAGSGAGGGVYTLGDLTLTNTTIKGNTARNSGGGVVSGGATTLTITNSTIGGAAPADGNTATNLSGGGIYAGGGLVITNSTIRNNNAGGGAGGGIYDFAGAAATITGSTISDNTAAMSAGGIYMENAQLTLTDTTISGNTATGNDGGGVFSYVNLSLSNSTISGNSAPAGLGGGVYARRTVNISGATISGNTAGTFGGGVYLSYDGAVVTNAAIDTSTISGNTSSGQGGGIYNTGGGVANKSVVTITDTTISGNTGNGIYNFDAGATATITGSTLSGNSGSGAGIRNAGTATLTNTTISGNAAGAATGGAILSGALITVTNCTITNNSTTQNVVDLSAGGTFSNTIIASNAGFAECSGVGVAASNGYNLIGDNSCPNLNDPTDLHNATANLGALASNGGATQTHALLTGSDALDAGDCDGGAVTDDQRGVARPQNGTCDIGAYEARPYTVTVTRSGSGSVADTNSLTGFDIACGATCSDSALEGSSVTLTATPSGGYYFSGWSGACSGTGNCALSTITANKNVTATFTAWPEDEPAASNTPPHYDGGGDDWLVWPAQGGSNVATSTGLIWKKLTDDEGDAISYETRLCANYASGECVGEWTVAARVESRASRNAMAALGFGAAMIAGFGFVRTRRGRAVMLALLILASGAAAASCGSSSTAENAATPESRSCDGAAADEECQSVTGLSPETEYHWKVVAADSAGAQVESATRSFTTGK